MPDWKEKKIKDELEEKIRLIKKLRAILKSKTKIMGIIKEELTEASNKYGNGRMTKIIKTAIGEFSQEDMVPNEDVIITLTREGYIKRIDAQTYHVQHRGGKGVIGATTKEEDVVNHLFVTNTHSNLLFFTNFGRVFQTKAYEIPASARTAKGQAIVNFLQLSTEEIVTAVISINKKDTTKFLVMSTKNGIIKKTNIEEFANVRRSGLIAIKLKKGDELRWVRPSDGNNNVILASSGGQSIRFKEKDIRSMGRNASGVKAIKLKPSSKVISMDVVIESKKKKTYIFTISENGFGKISDLKFYKIQHRGGSGIKTAIINAKTGQLVDSRIINENQLSKDLLLISRKGQIIRTPFSNISKSGRATQGVRVMRLGNEDRVSSIAIV